jgi:precorrin-8X/cobalt-precorrin-8 methylmutase
VSTYIRDGAAIYERSFSIIRTEADLSRFSDSEAEVAVRMIHACGMVGIAKNIVFADGAVASAREALKSGAAVLCDSEMLSHGITRTRLPAANPVICTLRDGRVPALAERYGTTRSAAALELWGEDLQGAIVAIGNAPTSLFRLLEMLDEGARRPALILGMPVGFVGAAESKDALIADSRGIPYVSVRGRIGGSAMAAAAINALAQAGL